MQTLILVTLALATLPLALVLRRRASPAVSGAARSASAHPTPTPQRITNPRRANRPDVKVWVLKADPGCELTRDFLHNHRYRAEEAVALPAMGCNLSSCGCRYEPVADTRRRERRNDDPRRNAIRFESRPDRRAQPDRRKNDVWQHGSLR